MKFFWQSAHIFNLMKGKALSYFSKHSAGSLKFLFQNASNGILNIINAFRTQIIFWVGKALDDFGRFA